MKILKFFKNLILIIIVLLVILAGIFFGITQGKNNGNWKLTVKDISSIFFGKPVKRNVLILGVSEDISTKLSDTIIFASYDPNKDKAVMISIPRDTFVGKSKGDAKASDKLNAIYKYGVDKSVKKVEELLGVKIDNYVVVKTSMLVKMVDSLGGVKFNVPIDMDYDDTSQDLHIHLKKGMQVIDGKKAEWLLRFRHNNDGSSYPSDYGNNDLGRMRTTREFIKETVKQLANFKNIFKINKIVDIVFSNIETDLTKKEMLTYVPSILTFDMNSLKMEQLEGKPERLNRYSFFLASENIKEQIDKILD